VSRGCVFVRNLSTVALHLSRRRLSGSAWPCGWICREFYKINLPWNYRLSDQIYYSVMASRTSNQEWSKGLDSATVNSNCRTWNCTCSPFS